MARNRFCETIENRPLTEEEFRTLVVDRLPLLVEENDRIVFYYEPARDDYLKEVRAVVFPNDKGVYLEAVFDPGIENSERIYTREVARKDKIVPLLKEILVDNQFPNDGWVDNSESIHAVGQSFEIVRGFPYIQNPTEEDEFSYVEALEYIINEISDFEGNTDEE